MLGWWRDVTTRSCLKWIGGKHKYVDYYLNNMPNHKTFISPFCGGCHFEIAKEASKNEIINDINDNLVNFLLVLRDKPEELYRMCEALPYSESLYNKYKWEPEPTDSLEKAARFFYIVRAGFSGGGHKYKTGFSISVTQGSSKVNAYRTAVELIPHMAERIKQWHILCRDFEDVITKYDSNKSFFFCDPPYIDCEELYLGGYTKEDHYRLRNALSNIKGKAMICYYDHPLVRDLYKGWFIEAFETKSKIQAREFGDTCPVRTELIIMNYDPITVNGQMRLVK